MHLNEFDTESPYWNVLGGFMISAGIVVEYNPFHNGHLYHLQQTRKKTEADVVIAVMSGQFLQRGEPALVSKYTRTKMALNAGVDLVIELPYAFCTQKAEIFALGAVQILSSLKVDYICFGSEAGNIDTFKNTISFLSNHETSYNSLIKQYIKKGVSYPKAASLAFHHLAPNTEADILDMSKPNNILGYHYMKAIQQTGNSITPVTIRRKQAGYHDEDLSDTQISSATSIRKVLWFDHSLKQIKGHVPEFTYEQLLTFQNKYGNFVYWENLWSFLKYRLIQGEPEELRNIYEVEEGLEYRLQRFAKDSSSFAEFMNKIKTKRYTWTRLQRACLHILTNTKKEWMINKQPEYIRILGFNQNGRKFLKEKKEEISLPVISKLSQADQEAIKLDVKASQIYAFAFQHNQGECIVNEELMHLPIIYNF